MTNKRRGRKGGKPKNAVAEGEGSQQSQSQQSQSQQSQSQQSQSQQSQSQQSQSQQSQSQQSRSQQSQSQQCADQNQATDPNKVAKGSASTQAASARQLQLVKSTREVRPGKKIIIETNHLPLTLKNYNIFAHHYDVTFEPDRPKSLLRSALNLFFERHFPGRIPISDGRKNLVSCGPLPNIGERELSDDVEIIYPDNGRKIGFHITIKEASRIDLSLLKEYGQRENLTGISCPQAAITVLDIILRNNAASKMVDCGRLFLMKDQITYLGAGLELWHGFSQSAILGWKPYVNTDVASKPFFKPGTVLDTIRDICRSDLKMGLEHWEKKKIEHYMKKVRIEYKIPNVASSKRKFNVNGFADSAAKQKFKLDDRQLITVEQYFHQQKRYKLKYPLLPCLWVGPCDKNIYLPVELCTVIGGQAVNGDLPEQQVKNMVDATTTSTDERKKKIYDGIALLDYDHSPYLEEFGIRISKKFERLEARILEPPRLEYKTGTIIPKRGVWQGGPFLEPTNLLKWCVLNLNQPYTDQLTITNFQDQLGLIGKDYGMNISKPGNPTNFNTKNLNPKMVETFFSENKNMDFIFVVLPNFGDDYSMIKKYAELRFGIITGIIKGKTMEKLRDTSVIRNILKKVNAKLNGTNHSVQRMLPMPRLNRPIMYVGADVTHPSPGAVNACSVAAVAASYDRRAFRYKSDWRLQPKGEMILDLENMMKGLLLYFFQKNNGCKPERIIFIRDGVSEGEIAKLKEWEVPAVRRACLSMQKDREYQPPITFLIVQKRHHTRFFPTDERDITDLKNKNVPPGTVVDTNIVHPRENEFYLLPHASIRGTARPSKYRVVEDDSDMTLDDLERMVYDLCHIYSRCDRSVSYPAPTYYAHLSAFRARHYIGRNERIDLENLDREQMIRQVNRTLAEEFPMFFV